MTGQRLVVLFLLILAFELMLFSDHADAWRRRRRRRRRYTPPSCDSSVPYPRTKWANKWQKPFSAHCRFGYSITQWESVYRTCKQDRIHHFKCLKLKPKAMYRRALRTRLCQWTPYLHYVKRTLYYRCPHNGFISGVHSSFVRSYHDRRFSFKCCHVRGYEHRQCKTILAYHYVNHFGGKVNYYVERGYRLVGVISEHSVTTSSFSKSDRIWKFEICKIKRRPWCAKN